MRHARGRARRGFMLLDIIVGLGIALLLLTAMTVAVGQMHRGERQLADTRAGMRQLETAALAMQTGGTSEKDLQVERLGEAAGGRVWVRISMSDARGKDRSLVALVPADKAGRTP